MKSKILAGIAGLVMCAASLTAPLQAAAPIPVQAADSKYNYAEALQKSMFFYEVQQSGKLPEWNNVPWRADSMVDEDGNETDVVKGGWFDAGDHFKFTLTNAYSASMLGWGYIEYEENLKKAGLDKDYLNMIEWGMDYVNACYLGNGKLVGTIGDFTGGSTDHNIWCSAEVYLRKHHLNNGDWERPYDTVENSTVAGLAAAALAEGYIIFKDSQPDKAAKYLATAKELFELADTWRDTEDKGGMGSMYPTSSWVDDCMYAACWLYKATGDDSYLDKIKKDYIPNFPKESQSDAWKYTWGLCWDDTTQGAALLYAQISGEKDWIDHISHHLDYWIDGYGGKKIEYTPDGLAYLMNWGSLRHASTTAWVAFLACDTIFKDDATLSKKYQDWAKSQMDYCFGDNNLGQCYVLGMSHATLEPTAIHHRTASGVHDDHWNDLGQPKSATASTSGDNWQTEYAHTLYGALVGGPDKSGEYTNQVSKYEFSEVAIDYNAGFTSALAAMIGDYDNGSKLANFPPKEEPKWAEWEVAAVLNGKGDSYTEVKAWAMNHTAWPARVAKDISYHYYFNIEELLKAGLSVDDIKVEAKPQQYSEGEQGFATVTGPYKFEGDPSGNTYYAEIKFEDGRAIQPTGQSEHRDEVQFRVSIPDAIDGQSTKGAWDPENDWSYEGLTATDSLKDPKALNEHFTMYVNGALVWGEEPDGTKPTGEEPTEPKTDPDPTPTEATKPDDPQNDPTTDSTSDDKPIILYGDVDLDGTVSILDVITLNKALMIGEPLSAEAKLSADVDLSDPERPDEVDSLNILKYVVEIVEALPIA
ncbi:MAG: glycoside hydrolase family 9 protein [Oscillospiraceae bacterium]|nr:glycoside hydrolase family 9 protein [Oscillospiraceae bacterium]